MVFDLYLLFIVSYLLHLPARIPILGLVRFDLLLIIMIGTLIVVKSDGQSRGEVTETDKVLRILLGYFVVTLPFVQWPGSVLWTGIPNLVKAVIFYFFTVGLVTTEERLRTFMGVFIACQSIRVVEPVYLHLVDGYWGDATFAGSGEFMDRLAGAPSDTVNPNGLAFVILTVIPFFHWHTLSTRTIYRLAYMGLFPIFVYALVLTASRSGMLGFAAILFGIFMKSQRKFLMVMVVAIGAVVAVANMNDLQKERYLSIARDDVRFAGTAQGRTEGILTNLEVVWNRPIFGHGLGTSKEANYHATGVAQPAHNLYVEILQEGGIVALIIFLIFMKSIIVNFRVSLAEIRLRVIERSYLANITTAMQVWLLMDILFSFGTYALSSYEWYLFGGLSVVIRRLAEAEPRKVVSMEASQWKSEPVLAR